MKLSVIIPAYRGEATIGECLASVRRAVEGYDAEVIVVESSSDSTARIVRREFPDVRLIWSGDRLSAGMARDRGIEDARGDVILFTDQDCIVPEDWVARLLRHLDAPGVAGVGGSVGLRNFESRSGSALYFMEFLHQFPSNGPPRRPSSFLVGCNAAYHADCLRVVRFPDQTYAEDVLMSAEMLDRGFALVYDPSIEVSHRNKEGWQTFLLTNFGMGEASAAYHQRLGLSKGRAFLRFPTLVFLAPFVVLPIILVRVWRAPTRYLRRFLQVLPMCAVGNFCWALGFWSKAHRLRGENNQTARVPDEGLRTPR